MHRFDPSILCFYSFHIFEYFFKLYRIKFLQINSFNDKFYIENEVKEGMGIFYFFLNKLMRNAPV